MNSQTEAGIINALEASVRKHGLIETSKAVNVSLAFVGHETPRYQLILSAWNFVLRSQR